MSLEMGCPHLIDRFPGGDITTRELIDRYCAPGMGTSRKKIPIRAVTDRPLWTILFTMQRVDGIQGVHQASREHMLYAIESMAPIVLN